MALEARNSIPVEDLAVSGARYFETMHGMSLKSAPARRSPRRVADPHLHPTSRELVREKRASGYVRLKDPRRCRRREKSHSRSPRKEVWHGRVVQGAGGTGDRLAHGADARSWQCAPPIWLPCTRMTSSAKPNLIKIIRDFFNNSPAATVSSTRRRLVKIIRDFFNEAARSARGGAEPGSGYL